MASCNNCGALLEEGTKFCSSCGQPTVSSPSVTPTPPVQQSDVPGAYAQSPQPVPPPQPPVVEPPKPVEQPVYTPPAAPPPPPVGQTQAYTPPPTQPMAAPPTQQYTQPGVPPAGQAPGYQPPPAYPYAQQPMDDTADIQNNKMMAVLSYFGILVLVPLFAAKNSKFARYHANQGLILLVVEVAYSIIANVINAFSY